MKYYLKVVNSETGIEQNYEFDSLSEQVEKIAELDKKLGKEFLFYIANDETLNRE